MPHHPAAAYSGVPGIHSNWQVLYASMIVRQLSYDLTPVVGMALVGHRPSQGSGLPHNITFPTMPRPLCIE